MSETGEGNRRVSTHPRPFWDAVDRIRDLDPRYRREAYGFVMAALSWTVHALPQERLNDPARRHLSGQELLRGVVALARQEFGVMAPMVFQEWGLRTSADVGALVFQLVEDGQLSAQPEDRIEDFAGGPDLLSALREDLDLGQTLPPGGRDPGPDA
jgi:uncharacterized repeat protein (TIGR04138 family)